MGMGRGPGRWCELGVCVLGLFYVFTASWLGSANHIRVFVPTGGVPGGSSLYICRARCEPEAQLGGSARASWAEHVVNLGGARRGLSSAIPTTGPGRQHRARPS